MINKAVITTAGLGTRLLPTTKELPKEMMPIFARQGKGLVTKPLLQMIFEQLYDVGIREFYFVVGRGKRAIEDHFTKDQMFIDELSKKGKDAGIMEDFYSKLSGTRLIFLNQEEPRGFGDAVLKAGGLLREDFFVAAGDTYIMTDGHTHLQGMLEAHPGNAATLMLKRVQDPSQYGVAILDGSYVKRVVEKPKERISDMAIMPFYAFSPEVFDHLAGLKPGVGGEVQLTDAIQSMIDSGRKVNAITVNKGLWLDIGNPQSYARALIQSYRRAGGRL
ncbi:MAG: hypothetical protein JRN10_07850 [Nitrososphaerota archaeon]|jgi:UTP--glucose-1-phosphate uridylyltransferase|nr:hypothetical protein [Nitrososphaerota archaeon]MDG6931132.1 hypothetical protein [Nitrososphaerota archaeon]